LKEKEKKKKEKVIHPSLPFSVNQNSWVVGCQLNPTEFLTPIKMKFRKEKKRKINK